MQVLIAVDDTDCLDKELAGPIKSTGQFAGLLGEELEIRGWGKAQFVSRHQLLVHPDVPYTSHNSAMCFSAEIGSQHLDDVIKLASEWLEEKSAPGSDPGLCVAQLQRLVHPSELIAFGFIAKNYVLHKKDAYQLAEHLGIHLSEHGGTGGGVIGALAGVGLRLGGNDGRIRGKIPLPGESGISVAEIIQTGRVDKVRNYLDGRILDPEEMVIDATQVKTVLINHESILLVQPSLKEGSADCWQPLTREQLRIY